MSTRMAKIGTYFEIFLSYELYNSESLCKPYFDGLTMFDDVFPSNNNNFEYSP